ncbi:MAG: hypothetical protein U0800_23440 [Isosphaeraceae bacterium]
MSARRPTISPDLVASMIESTPDRVRRRLDRSPDAAAEWPWLEGEAAWTVVAGEETVTLPHGHLAGDAQIRCTCLLSPRCFHVLACLTRLEVALIEAPPERADPIASAASDPTADLVEPSASQRHAARELVAAASQLLGVGVASGGVVVQSGLLRSIHQVRAEGLHRAAAMGLRVLTGTGEVRSRSPSADPAQLAEDVADLLETCQRLLHEKAIPGFWIGTARRRQIPVRPRKLRGLFAEPILTRTGFAGAAAYLLGDDGRIYTASDVRPGEARHARDAYMGGIEIGTLIQPAKRLARGVYLGTDLTASPDGRLGRGKGIRIAEQGSSNWYGQELESRFQRPLEDQWAAMYEHACLPEDTREAGWDFAFFEGTILGASGPELLFQPIGKAQIVRLAIANEGEDLSFRENLRMLSHAPGLRLKIIGRVSPADPRIVSPLAVAPISEGQRDDHGPRLEIPDSWCGRVCLGFDEIQRPFLVNARPSPGLVPIHGQPIDDDPLGPLRRRWIAAMLSGIDSRRASGSHSLRAEATALGRLGFATGAALLETLTSVPSAEGPTPIETFLATAVYLRTCSLERARFLATLTAN